MNTKALRQKVLDLAIHGKLVSQNPNDESATVLLEKIRAEKAEKIKKGELKADKKDSFIFVGSDKRHYEQFADGTVKDIEEEIPFDVPEGWTWERIGNVLELINGRAYKKSELLSKGKYRVLRVGNFFTNDSWYFSDLELEDNKYCYDGDLLYAWSASFGPKIWTGDKTIFHYHIWNVKFDEKLFSKFFLYYFLLKDVDTIKESTSGSTMVHVSMENMKPRFICIPPLAEQQRIVSIIESIFSHIDTVEQNKFDLQTEIKQAKTKILDLAIHGKLVPQDPNDEPAEELLKRIATSDNRPYKKFDDEEPFDIPESWSWCTLGEIYTHTTGKALKKTNNKGTLRKYITTSNLYWNSFDFTEVREMYFTDDELEKCTIKKGDLILCNGGDVGRAAIWNYDYDICYQNHVSRLRPKNENINNSFFLYLMMIYKQQGMLNGKGVGITSLSASDLLSAVIPLPPYTEQQRIVSKIEELFSYLDTISSNLE